MLKRVKIIDEKMRTRLLLHLSAARSLLSNWSVKSVPAPSVYNIGFQGILLFFPELANLRFADFALQRQSYTSEHPFIRKIRLILVSFSICF